MRRGFPLLLGVSAKKDRGLGATGAWDEIGDPGARALTTRTGLLTDEPLPMWRQTDEKTAPPGTDGCFRGQRAEEDEKDNCEKIVVLN